MCGIAGFWAARFIGQDVASARLQRMNRALIHRGPDGSGIHFDAEKNWGFAHRRLAVIDLSEAGIQPMWSPSGRYVITYNGEVYNFAELRAELLSGPNPPQFQGTSDTEILLGCLDAWGIRRTLSCLRGMFAFGLWDSATRSMHLVRDRLGVKPLYFAKATAGPGFRGFIFASELSAIATTGWLPLELDLTAVSELTQLGVVPAPRSIYRNVYKLLPGEWLSFSQADAEPRSERFWRAEEAALAGLADPFAGDAIIAEQELERRLLEAVRLRLTADVPVGALLSGGVDSSTVVALMQSQSTQRIKTFCIGYADSAFDESALAASVAAHLGTEHQTLTARAGDALRVIPDLARIYDEPFADASQIPTFLVSRLAREHVTVALSGDGGDEVFGGYNRHVWVPLLWQRLKHLPRGLRHEVGQLLRRIPPDDWSRLYSVLQRYLPELRLPGDKLHKIARVLDAKSGTEMYRRLRSNWTSGNPVLNTANTSTLPANTSSYTTGFLDFAAAMMLDDLVSYLPDDILTKVDRASMAVALEVRVPLLDHKLIEFSWQLPQEFKVHEGQGKWILRRTLERYVPLPLFDRAKTGFGLPLGDWLRGELRDWAEPLISADRLRREQIFDPVLVQRTWRDHLSRRVNHEDALWPILVFQAWHESRATEFRAEPATL